jgi:CheY-like chemotaxis protein
MRSLNNFEKKMKDNHIGKRKNKTKKDLAIYPIIENNKQECEDLSPEERKQMKEIKESKKKRLKKNYKQLLNKNFNKTRFYLFELKNIFLKNEIYIHLSQRKKKKCVTEPNSVEREKDKGKKLNKKNSFRYSNNNNNVYIIICDDEEFVARSARELIIKYYLKKGMDPHVYFTPNGIECLYLMYKLSIIENRKIEYILMDREMPYLNGIRACNIIKSIHEIKVRVFILSGDEPINCEADGYCNKPLNEVDIINKLDVS